jgi:hypothetical protein
LSATSPSPPVATHCSLPIAHYSLSTPSASVSANSALSAVGACRACRACPEHLGGPVGANIASNSCSASSAVILSLRLASHLFSSSLHRAPESLVTKSPVVHLSFFSIICAMPLAQLLHSNNLPFSWGGLGVPSLLRIFSLSNVPTILRSIPFLFKFLRTLLHFFALTENSTLFFPMVSALCVKNRKSARGIVLTSLPSSRDRLELFPASDVAVLCDQRRCREEESGAVLADQLEGHVHDQLPVARREAAEKLVQPFEEFRRFT